MPGQSSNDGLPKCILDFLGEKLGADALSKMKVAELKSAQQRVWALETFPLQDSPQQEWAEALKLGKNRIIARQWKASSCWWNLNNNQDKSGACCIEVEALARSEVAGYRIARQALPEMHIPAVLHFSLDRGVGQRIDSPWAILSYVGPKSTVFDGGCMENRTWMDGMVKTRFEFGFEEPHPRWGRVPNNKCVDYTLSVLEQVTIPLHQFFRGKSATNVSGSIDALRKPASLDHPGFSYKSMVQLYEREHNKIKLSLVSSNDTKLKDIGELLGEAICKLTEEKPYLDEPLKPLVVCHMDCQPQNLLFAGPVERDGRLTGPRILSVFDWEEAALADPRFELLLLCRKVCANRNQAEEIWKLYDQDLKGQSLGPLAPWLALETVHSIISLLLQSMDLLGGGRSPWESKPDLWGKIQREVRRLVLEHAWDFCDAAELH